MLEFVFSFGLSCVYCVVAGYARWLIWVLCRCFVDCLMVILGFDLVCFVGL